MNIWEFLRCTHSKCIISIQFLALDFFKMSHWFNDCRCARCELKEHTEFVDFFLDLINLHQIVEQEIRNELADVKKEIC